MEHLNVFVLQLAVLFLPGIIWAGLDSRYGTKEKLSAFEFILRAFVFGVASYAVTFLVYALTGHAFAMVDFVAAQTQSVLSNEIGVEVLAATVVGCLLGLIWVYATTWKLLTRFLQLIRATKRYGDEDVWDFTFNAPTRAVRFVHVRDFEKEIVYAGKVNAFSDTGRLRELTLLDVEIFDFDGKLMYEVPRLYLARKADDIHIEFPLSDRDP